MNTLTLPGYVLRANNESEDVYTTDDLRAFLCPLYLSQATVGRSHLITFLFDYSDETATLNGGVDNLLTHETYMVESITIHGIRLNKCYRGPVVREGYPRVHICTNLQVCRTGDNQQVLSNRTFGPERYVEDVGLRWRPNNTMKGNYNKNINLQLNNNIEEKEILSSLLFGSQITTITAHPS